MEIHAMSVKNGRQSSFENAINDFLSYDDIEVIDIKYQVAIMYDNKEQIFCFSAMIIYNKKD